jgi:type I restriction enzyme S subunit
MTTFNELLGYPLRSGVTVAAAKRGVGIRMVNMKELFAFRRLGDVSMARVTLGDVDPDRHLLRPGDLLFARRSLTAEGAGQCTLVVDVPEDTTWESSILRARVDPEKAVPEFLYYYFSSPLGRQQMDTIVDQVAAAGVRSSDLGRLDVPCPTVSTQAAIVAVLGALDDKIAVNQQVLAESDELIRLRYQRLEPSDSVTLGDLAENHRQQVSAGEIGPNEPYVGLEHFDSRSVWLSRRGKGSEVTSAKAVFQAGDTLFGRLRPYFHKVAIPDHGGVCSTDILVLRAKRQKWRWLLAAAASSDNVVARAVQNSNGTKMPRAKWADIAPIPVPDPDTGESRELSHFIVSLFERGWCAIQENQRLAETRDELLPLLLGGQITVKAAEERVVKEV